MFGKNTLKNVKSLNKANLSMKVVHTDEGDVSAVNVILYADKKNEHSDLDIQIVGSVIAYTEGNDSKLNDKAVYGITGISGAYKGFGSLLYQSLLIELRSIDENALFISDRSSITGGAEGLYKKMIESNLFEKERISPDCPHYSDELDEDVWDLYLPEEMLDKVESYEAFLALIESETIPNTPVNTAYKIIPTEQMLLLHKTLKKNDVVRSLTSEQSEQLIEEASNFGEWVEYDWDAVTEEMMNGYSGFGIEKNEKKLELELS